MPREKLTEAFAKDATVEPGKKRTTYWDEGLPSFGLRVTKAGHKSYVVQYRAGHGRAGTDRRLTIGSGIALDVARKQAKKLLGQVATGLDPLKLRRDDAEKATGALKSVCENYLQRECGMVRDDDGTASFAEGRKLRSAPQRLAVFERVIYPDKIASQPVGEIKRSDINRLLDSVEDTRGPQAAHQVLAFLSRVFSWYASRHDDFHSPIVRGMGSVKARERAGTRVLSDEEIRDLFAALDAGTKDIPTCFASLVKTLLLTAVRRVEAARLAWPEIERLKRDDFASRVATIPASRMKGKLDHAVPLVPAVLAIIGERPADAKRRPFVFSNTGGATPYSDFGNAKLALDREIARLRKSDGREPMPPWQLSRDIRRTAKTLMQRAGVRPDISERVLAHVISGVEGVYDRWSYLPEKHEALERLAALISRIINPPPANVRPFPTEKIAVAS